MQPRMIRSASLATITLACVGCAGGGFSFSYHDYDPAPVHVARVYARTGHVCTPDCVDHYWDGARILVVKGHRHHRGCGHVWNGSHWVVAKRIRVKPTHGHGKHVVKVKHVHGPACGCVYDGRVHQWIKVRAGHVHDRGCGHVYIDGRWTIRP